MSGMSRSVLALNNSERVNPPFCLRCWFGLARPRSSLRCAFAAQISTAVVRGSNLEAMRCSVSLSKVQYHREKAASQCCYSAGAASAEPVAPQSVSNRPMNDRSPSLVPAIE